MVSMYPTDDDEQLSVEQYPQRKTPQPKPLIGPRYAPKPLESAPTHPTDPPVAEADLTRASLPKTQPMRDADGGLTVPMAHPRHSPPPTMIEAVPPRAYPPSEPPLVVYAAPSARPPRAWLALLISIGGVLTIALMIILVALRAIHSASTPVPTVKLIQLATFPPQPTATPGLLIEPWQGKERFTVLMLGLDKRPNDRGTAFRTDSMILVSIDPTLRKIGMLSIPRDLYVEIPPNTVVGQSYGLQRINTAYFLGETAQPGAGPMLAMQTVQYNLGIRVHDYIVYDFEAVMAAIDAIGGVDITVEREIIDREYPALTCCAYDPLYIQAGRQTMNGELALKYARSRHGTSDFDRARRQQQVIQAMREKILNLELLPGLIAQAPTLWSQFSRHVQSGLSLEQWLQLALYAKDIPAANITQGVIDSQYTQSAWVNGAAVLSPNRAAIGTLLVEVFGINYNN